MYFGNFLVQKKLLTKKQLIEVVTSQLGEIPPLSQIVFEKELLDEEQVFSALNKQQEDCSDFKSACQALELWNSNLEEAVSSIVSEQRRPLVDILLERKLIEFDVLVEAIDEYINSKIETVGADSPVASQPISTDLIDEFSNHVNDSNKQKLMDSIVELKKTDVFGEASDSLTLIFTTLHEINGACSFIRAVQCQKLAETGEALVDTLRADYIAQNSEDINSHLQIMEKLTLAIFDLAGHIIESGTEGNYLSEHSDQLENLGLAG